MPGSNGTECAVSLRTQGPWTRSSGSSKRRMPAPKMEKMQVYANLFMPDAEGLEPRLGLSWKCLALQQHCIHVACMIPRPTQKRLLRLRREGGLAG